MTTVYPWFENCKAFITPMDALPADYVMVDGTVLYKWTAAKQRFGDLEFLCRSVPKWLDTTHIADDPRAIAMAKQIHCWFFEFCNWQKLNPKQHEPVETMRVTAVRLDNLLKSIR